MRYKFHSALFSFLLKEIAALGVEAGCLVKAHIRLLV
jgi:hypothetical protein